MGAIYKDLKNKFILISGSEGIIGKELVRFFIENQANLILVDILDNSANYDNDKITYLKCDLSKAEEIKKLEKKILDITNTIDVLINNAATKTGSTEKFFEHFDKYSIDTWREVMSVNIDAPFLMCQMLQPFLKNSKKGASVVNISSVYGVVAPNNQIYKGSKYLNTQINSPAVYSTSKAALIGFSKYLSTYWANLNIRVNCVSPGGVESGQNNTFIKRYSERVPMGRMAKKDEVASTILFLASNHSSYINGQNIIVDGGLTTW